MEIIIIDRIKQADNFGDLNLIVTVELRCSRGAVIGQTLFQAHASEGEHHTAAASIQARIKALAKKKQARYSGSI